MPKFYEPDILAGTEHYLIEGENYRHISRSLRMKTGDNLTLTDGKGNDFEARITDITEAFVEVDILKCEKGETEASVRLHLYQGVPKSDKMELIIQKFTELGGYSITPTKTDFTVSDISGKEDKKVARWQKIALEGAMQSKRSFIPIIKSPEKFKDAIQNAPGAKLLLYEGGGIPIKELIKGCEDISVFVGPEGGFSEKEVNFAKEKGARIVTLGKRILRTETAPLAAAAIIMYETGNME